MQDFQIIYQKFFDYPPSSYIYFTVGQLLNVLRLVPRAKFENVNLFEDQNRDFIAKSLKSYSEMKYYSLPEEERRNFNFKQYWGSSKGVAWHQNSQNNEQSIHKRKPLTGALTQFVAENPQYTKICEIGTGNGNYLLHLSKLIPGLKYTGIDINENQIKENEKTYSETGLKLLCCDPFTYIDQYSIDSTIFVAVGTLEYLSQYELENLLKNIKSKNAAFGLIEPINIIDFSSRLISRPRGNLAYSHNYPHLFNKHGFDIVFMHNYKGSSATRDFSLLAR
jgi:hypothetical protein